MSEKELYSRDLKPFTAFIKRHNDLVLTKRIFDILDRLDRLVFPENSIKNVRVVEKRVDEDPGPFSYSYKEGKGNEYYRFNFIGMKDFIHQLMKDENMFRLRMKTNIQNELYGPFPPTEEETIITIVSHEVRHRWQWISSADFFSVNDLEIPSLKTIIKTLIVLFNANSPPQDDYDKEFDADVIQYLASREWRNTHNLSMVAKIIKLEPKDFQG